MKTQNLLQIALTELDKRYPVNAQYDFLVELETQKKEISELTSDL